jgi:NAD+ synthase (glutamine-hydrolysing)
MAYSNLYNSLLLSTSNKSELATGYGTLYGDMNGGLLPIGDLYKTQVFQMARWYQKKRGLIPEEIITRPPSAELRPNQKDQDSLPEYSKLDRSLMKIIEHGKMGRSKTDLFSLQKILGTEFKRWQGAPILKVSSRSFGRGRHWPISHGFKF